MPKTSAAAVALIANDIITRKINSGGLDVTDFTDYIIPGTNGKTYRQKTMETACAEAWEMILAAEQTRPVDWPDRI